MSRVDIAAWWVKAMSDAIEGKKLIQASTT